MYERKHVRKKAYCEKGVYVRSHWVHNILSREVRDYIGEHLLGVSFCCIFFTFFGEEWERLGALKSPLVYILFVNKLLALAYQFWYHTSVLGNAGSDGNWS